MNESDGDSGGGAQSAAGAFASDAPGLRAKAEALYQSTGGKYVEPLAPVAALEATRALHELGVYAIELELQNEELRQRQAELDASRAHFVDFYDLAPVGYLTVSESGLIVRANLTMAAMLGLPRAVLPGTAMSQIIMPADQDAYHLLRTRVLSTGRDDIRELRLRRADGTPLWVGFATVSGHEPDGTAVLRCVLRDVSELKRAEEAHRRLARLYAARSECADAILRCQSEAELFPAVCEAAARYGGFALVWVGMTDEATGQVRAVASSLDEGGYLSGLQISVKKDDPHSRGPTGTAIREGVPTWFDDLPGDAASAPWRERITRAGWSASASLPLRRGGAVVGALSLYTRDAEAFDEPTRTLMLELAEDLNLALDRFTREAARQRAEDALRASEELLAALFEHSPALMYVNSVTPTESRFLRASRSFVGASGPPSTEVLGKTMSDLFPADLAASITADDWQVVSSGKPLVVTNQVGSLTYESVKFPLTIGGQRLLAGFSVDVTARKAAEAHSAALEAQARLVQKSDSLGRMAAAVAHHFNNHLHALMMNLDFALDSLPSDEEAFELLAEARQSARKAADVSGQMLAYLGQSSGTREVLSLSECCARQLPLLRDTLPAGVRLDGELPESSPAVRSNAGELHRVLGNLVHNAADACADSRGTIRVSGGLVAAGAVPSAHRFPVDWHPTADTYAYVEVADTGRGIPAGEIDTIFDPFYTTKFVGRGLGLSVALGIVRAHDGVITVESEVGRGSVFRVYLPAEPAAPSFVGLADAASETHAARGSVLLVDDEPGVRKTVARALRGAGFTVLEAADGAAALELFRAHQSDLACVLCDVTMPRMDGWQTLTELRRLAPGFPVILASGYGEAQVMEGVHPERPMAFLSKPYQSDLLVHTLDRVISERG